MLQLTNEWIEAGMEEGIEKGATEEALAILLRMGRKRLGNPNEEVLVGLSEISDKLILEDLCEKIYEVESWSELFEETHL